MTASTTGDHRGSLLRVWSTLTLEDTPDNVAADALKQARLWEAVGSGEDARFGVTSGSTYSDSDLTVLGREEDLLPVLTDLAYRGYRFHVDTRTEEDADRLAALHGEGGSRGYLLARVEHDTSGNWSMNSESR